MQEETNTNPKTKVYRQKAVWIGTLLGGPLVGGYFIAENFKAFNDPEKSKKTWIYTILTTIIVFVISFLLADFLGSGNMLIPMIYTAIAYTLMDYHQRKKIRKYIKNGGKYFSWWRTIGVTIIGIVITVIPFFGINSLIGNSSFSSKTYGKINHTIYYQKDNLKIKEIDKIANALTKAGFFDNSVPKYAYAEKTNNNLDIYISVVDGLSNNKDALKPFIKLKSDFEKYFPDKHIVFKLFVDELDHVIKTIK